MSVLRENDQGRFRDRSLSNSDRKSLIEDSGVSAFSNYDRKINLLIAAAGLDIGGLEVVIQQLAQTIDRSRFNLTLCCIKVCGVIGEDLAREGFDIVTLSNSDEPKVDYFTFIKLLKLIRLKKIDIVHTHTVDALADAAVCKLLMPRLKLVHTFHFGNYPHRETRIMWQERIFSKLANRVFAVGEVQRQQLMAVYHFPEEKIGRVWNGISPLPSCHDGSFRLRVGAENRILIGTIATLIEQKGLRDFLAVAREFRDAGDRVRFVIVGDGHLRPELDTIRRELGLDDTVVFTGWVLNASEVALPAFDIFFQPSLWEAMSIVILEAMAAGKAIVATRVGENPFVIEDDVDGLLVEAGDIDGMTAALGRLINDEKLRKRLGKAAARKIAEQFTAEHMTRAYERLYIETVGADLP